MTTGRINQIATVRDRARPVLAERALNDPESLEFKRALAKATKGFGSHSAVNSDRFRNTELDAPIIEQCSPSARTRPHSRSSSRGGSLAHPLGRRIGRGSRTVTLRRTQSPQKRSPVAAVGGAASRITSHDARSRSNSRHRLSRQLVTGVARESCISKPCDFYCAHCVPAQFFIPVGQSSAWLAAVCE